MSKPIEHLHLRVSPALKKELQRKAKKQRKSVNRLINDILDPTFGTTKT